MEIQRWRLALAERNEATHNGMICDKRGAYVAFADHFVEMHRARKVVKALLDHVTTGDDPAIPTRCPECDAARTFLEGK